MQQTGSPLHMLGHLSAHPSPMYSGFLCPVANNYGQVTMTMTMTMRMMIWPDSPLSLAELFPSPWIIYLDDAISWHPCAVDDACTGNEGRGVRSASMECWHW